MLIGCIYLPDGNPQPGPKFDYKLAWFIKQGWTDALGQLHGDGRVSKFWHYLRNRWQRNAGLRLDHILLSPLLAPRLKDAGVDLSVRGKQDASDHARRVDQSCR